MSFKSQTGQGRPRSGLESKIATPMHSFFGFTWANHMLSNLSSLPGLLENSLLCSPTHQPLLGLASFFVLCEVSKQEEVRIAQQRCTVELRCQLSLSLLQEQVGFLGQGLAPSVSTSATFPECTLHRKKATACPVARVMACFRTAQRLVENVNVSLPWSESSSTFNTCSRF